MNFEDYCNSVMNNLHVSHLLDSLEPFLSLDSNQRLETNDFFAELAGISTQFTMPCFALLTFISHECHNATHIYYKSACTSPVKMVPLL